MAITIPAGETRPVPTMGIAPPILITVIGTPGESGAVKFSLILADSTEKNFIITYPGISSTLIDQEILMMATYHYGSTGSTAYISLT